MRQIGKKREMFTIISSFVLHSHSLHMSLKLILFMYVVFPNILVVKMFVLCSYRITINNE